MVFLAGGLVSPSKPLRLATITPSATLRQAFVFLDQRGTGGSASLACADDLEPLFAKDFEWWMTRKQRLKLNKRG